MSGHEHLQRGPVDFFLFGMMFLGFVMGAAGLVTTTPPVAVLGVALMLLGLCAFIIKGD